MLARGESSGCRAGLADGRNSHKVRVVVNIGSRGQVAHRGLKGLAAHLVLHGPRRQTVIEPVLFAVPGRESRPMDSFFSRHMVAKPFSPGSLLRCGSLSQIRCERGPLPLSLSSNELFHTNVAVARQPDSQRRDTGRQVGTHEVRGWV